MRQTNTLPGPAAARMAASSGRATAPFAKRPPRGELWLAGEARRGRLGPVRRRRDRDVLGPLQPSPPAALIRASLCGQFAGLAHTWRDDARRPAGAVHGVRDSATCANAVLFAEISRPRGARRLVAAPPGSAA